MCHGVWLQETYLGVMAGADEHMQTGAAMVAAAAATTAGAALASSRELTGQDTQRLGDMLSVQIHQPPPTRLHDAINNQYESLR